MSGTRWIGRSFFRAGNRPFRDGHHSGRSHSPAHYSHQIELPHVAVELNQSEVPHASHHFHPVLRDRLDLHSSFRLRGKQNIQPGKRQHSLPHVRGLPGLPLALFKHATARRNRFEWAGPHATSGRRALQQLAQCRVSSHQASWFGPDTSVAPTRAMTDSARPLGAKRGSDARLSEGGSYEGQCRCAFFSVHTDRKNR